MNTKNGLLQGSKALTVLASSMLVAAPASAAVVVTTLGQSLTTNLPLDLDLNSDGSNDLRFSFTASWYSGYYGGSGSQDLWAYGLGGAAVTAGGPVAPGATVDGLSTFTTENHLADYDHSYSSGYCGRWSCYPGSSSTYYTGTWNQGGSTVQGLLGFELADGVDRYFGWVDMTMYASGYAVINRVGLETCVNVGVVAGSAGSACTASSNSVPEPSSLALLALGAAGIGAVRRRQAARADA